MENKTIRALFKAPEQDPVIVDTVPSEKTIIGSLGGAYYKQDIQLSTGKMVTMFYYQMSVRNNLKYNFTICPTDDKRTWIDICGAVLVFGSGNSDIYLTKDEINELFKIPYEF